LIDEYVLDTNVTPARNTRLRIQFVQVEEPMIRTREVRPSSS
jgi:hypothetical protein